MKRITYVAAVLIMALAGPARAQIPVTDVANLAQQILQVLNTINQLQQQYEAYSKQIEQYQQQIKQYESMVGSYGMGELYSGDQAKTYAPEAWERMLAILEAGGSPGDAADVAAYVRQYQERYGFAPGDEVYTGENNQRAAYSFDQRAKTTRAALSISRAAYTKTGERLQRIQAYLEQIENATDLKAAIDLQNRLSVELMQALLEQNRLLAVQMQLRGTQSAQHTQQAQSNGALFRFRAE